MSATEETRQFKPHPHLLFDVIFRQSGTLAKALCELVINSVDAGATRVDVLLSTTGFTVSDDGRGFADHKEITEFFETFGTPHDEAEQDRPRFGTFRMGRGQAFAWAATDWSTGRFQMQVDVKNKGFDYGLAVHDETLYPGCTVVGKLYESIDPYNQQMTERDLTELVHYIDVPITLNGKCISHDPAKEQWDHVDDDAYIRFTKKSGVSVYNLGMFVRRYSGDAFGVNAEIVSRKQLGLCTARNEILDNFCDVWKRIRKVLAQHAGRNVRDTSKRMTAESRSFVFSSLLSGNTEPKDLHGLKIFKLANGRHIDLSALCRLPVTVAEDGDPRAERMIRTRTAYVLSKWTLEQCQVRTVDELLDQLGEAGCWGWYFFRPKTIDFEDKARLFTNEYKPVAYNDLDAHERAALGALTKAVENFCDLIRWRRRQNGTVTGLTGQRRKIALGDSDTAQAWTDGCETIWVNREFLTKQLASGPNGAYAVASVMVHEFCHDHDDAGSHQHDFDFLETFHDTLTDDGDLVGRMVNSMVRHYLSNRKQRDLGLPGTYRGHFALQHTEMTDPVDDEPANGETAAKAA